MPEGRPREELPGRWHGIGPARYLGWRLMRILLAPLVHGLWRIRVSGKERLPARGPYLLLPNHTSLLDPIWVAVRLGRPAHFMAAAQLWRWPLAGRVISFFGAFQKQKNVKDRESMRTVAALYEAGQIVTIFVEGQRTWDGRLMPVGEGVGRMVKRLGARVVTARVTTGHLHQPRWSTRMRWVPVHIAYDPPREWPEEATAAEITADIVASLQIDPHPRIEGLAFGRYRARGLPGYLFGCPRCGSLGTLEVTGSGENSVGCTACGAAWAVDLESRLHGEGDTESLTLVEARDALEAHLGQPPVADRGEHEADGTVLRGEDLHVGRLVGRGAEPELLASGPGRLTAERLEVGQWSVPLAELTAAYVQVAGIFNLRTESELLQLRTGGDSPLLWLHFIEAWRRRARGDAG